MANFVDSIKNLGWEGLRVYFQLKAGNTHSVSLKELDRSVYLRPDTTDASTFKQIFLRREYDVLVSFEPKVIFDIGANIGLAAVYFANRFKEATIISVEPSSANFEMLEKNASGYSKIIAIKSALWSEQKFLRIVDKGADAWGFTVEETVPEDPDSFAAVSIKDIMEQYHVEQIDILKIDIEGAELEVFSKNYEYWLPRTRLLIIETHDMTVPGSSLSVLDAIDKYNFSRSESGENHVFYNNEIK